MRRQRKQTKKRSVKATVTGFILIKGVKSSESTKVRKSDVWGCLQRLCHTCLSAVRFRTLFWRFETSKLRFFWMPPETWSVEYTVYMYAVTACLKEIE